MSTPVTMPQLGESVTEGTVTRWLKEVGDTVDVDEPLLEVSTDKVDTEIPSPAAGVLTSIDAPDDTIVEVGALLGTVGVGSDQLAQTPTPPPPADMPSAPPAPPAAATPAAPAPPVATPAASAPPAPPDPAPTAAPTSAAGDAAGTEVTLPELGESVTEGTVTRWLKQVGDSVDVDEPLLEISTDKVDTEIPSPVAGTLVSIAAAEDAVVEIGAVLGIVGSADAPGASAPAAAPAPATPEPAPAPAEPTAAPTPPTQPTTAPAPAPVPAATTTPAAAPAAAAPTAPGKVAAAAAYVTPLVRKLASRAGIDLAKVSGTGVGGRIRRQDVEQAIEAAGGSTTAAPATTAPAAAAPATAASASTTATAPAVTPPAAAGAPGSELRGSTVPMTRLRKVIADRMLDSLHTSAQLTTVVEADVTAIARLRDRVKTQFQQREGVKLSFLPFFALAVIEALKVHPKVNASIAPDSGHITYHAQEDLGVAVDTDRGLLVPVIQDAGELNLAGLARRIADLAERTRTNKVTPDELSGGTFTLTNTGSRGALFDTPIINQPQVAIMGTGTVNKRPVVIPGSDGGDVIAVHSMVYLSLTYDHRLVDGADAARFLSTVKHRLEEGAFEGDVGL
ncbi:MAG: 2-oxoglutarate dehydrogenase, E2 component, dihydrolipoamide succinyltransferase [Actinomycetia bacterium]|nr:2-oxoglutarate dehydrogenase, E2 component, dihydrolipoamide succinyltransferase [Actinomycetes bacterium]MCH9800331.1 2-oxoglutarate dehydrogenase, E2 component, dihydrolipoamide succinyltransferase [Actinomycetes bacterium]